MPRHSRPLTQNKVFLLYCKDTTQFVPDDKGHPRIYFRIGDARRALAYYTKAWKRNFKIEAFSLEFRGEVNYNRSSRSKRRDRENENE